jgi:hypothetical protein
MTKHKLSKEKRMAKREQRQRQAREERERQKAALARDLEYLAERGGLNSERALSEATLDALYQSAEWRKESEFADLSFDAFEAGQSMNRVWDEKAPTLEKIKRLSGQDRDDMAFELNTQALTLLLTPSFQRQVLERLSRFRQRLRAERKRDTLAQAALVEMALRTSGRDEENDVWPMCMLVYAMFMDALDEYERQAKVTEQTLESMRELVKGMSPEEALSISASHPALQGLVQRVKSKPGLFDFLRRSAEKMIDEAELAVWKGEIRLGLFTADELERLGPRTISAMQAAGVDLQSEPGQVNSKLGARAAELVYDAAADLLDEIATPDRHTSLYATARQRLDELARQKGQTGMQALSLRAILHEDEPPSKNVMFVYAFLSEMYAMAQERVGKG